MVFLLISTFAFAQDFQRYFEDATLRLDYNFAGNARHQAIAVDELCRIPHWYGKKQRLNELPVEGNGHITVRQHGTNKVLYRNSFLHFFRNGLPTTRLKQTQSRLKMFF